ncbi:MAG: hypothetical protein Q7K55_06700 [Candidatus Levybacteria bacterium]|nr:hypothetical protein [Candidatus Levybacteria bacterium]
MIEFFVISGILFSILLSGNFYYHLLITKNNSGKKNTAENAKPAKKRPQKNLFLIFISILAILIITALISLSVIHLISQNIFIIYMGILTFAMLTLSFIAILNSPNKLFYSITSAIILIALQIYLQIPLFGALLSTLGYIGAINYIMYKKLINPKIILFFLTAYMIYDFLTVFITPLQPALAQKTINNIFPSVIMYGKTLLGLGDVLFTLIMTSFVRVYYSLSAAIIIAFLLSLPLVILGIYTELVPDGKIALPYLVLSTPIFLIVVFVMKQRGYKLK